MRIIAGRLGGRQFASPSGHRTHPMSDKIRGALFNSLGDISGLSVLDAFAGSGALAFEAVSRGADSALAIDSDKNAARAIKENIELLGLDDKVKSIKAFFNAWSNRHQQQTFDIVIADPPFDNIPFRDLDKLPRHIGDNGLLIVCWPGNMRQWKFEGFEVIQSKDYNDAQLVFYRRLS